MAGMRPLRPLVLTFALSPEAAARLQAELADIAAAGRTREARVEQVWWDTPDDALRRSHLTLALVRSGRRRHWEARAWPGDIPTPDGEDAPLLNKTIDIGALPGQHQRVIERRDEEALLREAFRLETTRRVRLDRRGAATVEIAIDSGAMIAEGARIDLHELRLTLLAGRVGGLFALARNLAARAPMRLTFASRVARGYRLRAGAWGEPASKPPLRVRREMNTTEAFVAIAHACLEHLSLNEPAFHDAHAIEAVHQSRVAIRRLRAAFSLFAPMLRDDQFVPLQNDLKQLFTALGAARDLDIARETMLERPLADRPDANWLAAFDQRRRDAHAAAFAALISPATNALLLDLAEWIEAGAWRRDGAPKAAKARGLSIVAFATQRLRKRRQALRGMAAAFDTLDRDGLHKLRIEAKKLRYQAEFLEPVARDAKQQAFRDEIRCLADLQDTLGALRDLEAPENAPPDPSQATQTIAVASTEHRDALRHRVAREARAAAGLSIFKHLK